MPFDDELVKRCADAEEAGCGRAGSGVRVMDFEPCVAGPASAARPGTARSYGGFHHPAQGYRHVQMDAAVTVYGDLAGRVPVCPQSAALDLVRSYAHDCLHFATFRRYRLTDRGEIARVQYGINLRHLDGCTYSAPTSLAMAPPATWAS